MKTEKVKYMPNQNFRMIGISSVEKDFVLAWNLVKPLEMQFYLLSDIENEKRAETNLPTFDFGQTEPNRYTVFGNSMDSFKESGVLLISNKDSGDYLLDEFRNFDFLLIVRDDFMQNTDTILTKLRSVNCVSSAFLLPFESIKSKDRIYILWDSLQNRQ